jgi:hypothetical protein
MKRITKATLCILISFTPFLYLCFVWRSVPAIVPIHFNLAGKPDGFAPKGHLCLLSAGQALVPIGAYFLLDYVYSRVKGGPYPPPRFLPIMAVVLVLVTSAINFYLMLKSLGHL